MENNQKLKRCSLCKIWKSKDQFYKNGKKRLNSRCKDCAKAVMKKWYLDNQERVLKYRAENREKINKKQVEWREANRKRVNKKQVEKRAKNPQLNRDRQRQYRINNPEKHAAKNRRWAENNPEKVKEIQRRWAENNPEKYGKLSRDKAKQRRARMAGAKGNVAEEQWQLLLDYYNNVCLCCGIHAKDTREGSLTQDHIKPIVKGGPHTMENLQPLCRKCNSKKGVQTMDYRPNVPDWANIKIARERYTQLTLF